MCLAVLKGLGLRVQKEVLLALLPLLQGIEEEVSWLGLREGEDFGAAIDLAERLAVRKRKEANSPTRFPLEHSALGLLGEDLRRSTTHSAVADAQVAMRVYKGFLTDPAKTEAAKRRLRHLLVSGSFPKATHPHSIDGVCCCKYDDAHCSCWQQVDSRRHWAA